MSSSTASTAYVLAVASIVARERRSVVVMDIGGSFLNVDITSTGVKVHMRLHKVLTVMLVVVSPKHSQFVEEQGTSVVQHDKALYGCVEAAALWYANLCSTLYLAGFSPKPYDACVFNKMGSGGAQVTVVMHVDNLFVSSKSDADIEKFENYMRGVYNEMKVSKEKC